MVSIYLQSVGWSECSCKTTRRPQYISSAPLLWDIHVYKLHLLCCFNNPLPTTQGGALEQFKFFLFRSKTFHQATCQGIHVHHQKRSRWIYVNCCNQHSLDIKDSMHLVLFALSANFRLMRALGVHWGRDVISQWLIEKNQQHNLYTGDTAVQIYGFVSTIPFFYVKWINQHDINSVKKIIIMDFFYEV